MMSIIIYKPFEKDFCNHCYHYTTLSNGSRVCELAKNVPIRKIESCEEYIDKNFGDEIEAEWLREKSRKYVSGRGGNK